MTDNDLDASAWPEFPSSSEHFEFISEVPNFGVGQLTVKNAAVLIAEDAFIDGKISLNLPDADSYDPEDPKLIKALSKHENDFEKKLTKAIDDGSLKTTKILRDFNEVIDTNWTLLSEETLYAWLVERGHDPGEAYIHFCEDEEKLKEQLIDRIYAYRMERKCGKSFKDASKVKLDPDKAGIDELRQAVRDLSNENLNLYNNMMQLLKSSRERQENHQSKSERPLSTRSRKTLLTIIAALCNEAGIGYQDRGAAKRISELTDEIGASVSDDTVRKILGDIDDAIESRMK